MKKVAILTQPLGYNYGGIIQNYALQKILKRLGYEPITIDRSWKSKNSNAKLFLINLKVALSKSVLRRNVLTDFDRRKMVKHTRQFINSHILRSPRIDDTSKLIEYFNKEKFQAVVVGSDQTWRPKYSPNIFNYYLDFLRNDEKIIKIAYASSFGTEDWEYTEEQATICKELVLRFDAISVRETSGVSLCKEYLHVDAVHLLDPTFLLSVDDYSELIDRPKQNKQLFTYVLDDRIEIGDFIQTCATELGLEHNTNQARYKFDAATKRSLADYTMPPLEGWLQGFRDAEFVITDSFHGTVFSIINNKPFFALVNRKRGASRFESILEQLGLEDRLIYDVNNFDVTGLKSKIDYQKVNKKIEALKNDSFIFLKKSLQ